MYKSVYDNDIPKWVKNGASSSVISVSKLNVAKVEGNFLILEKEGVDYVCRNQDDIYQSWYLTNNGNPGWTLEESVDAQLSRFNSERCEITERLNYLDEKISKLESWKLKNAGKSS